MKIGDPWTFRPTAFINCCGAECLEYPKRVTGKVVGFHRGHRWFRVAFTVGRSTQHECFPMPVPPDPDPPSPSAGHRADSEIMRLWMP